MLTIMYNNKSVIGIIIYINYNSGAGLQNLVIHPAAHQLAARES